MVPRSVYVVCVFVLAIVRAQLPPSYYYQNQLTGTGTVYTGWLPGAGCGYEQNPPPGYQVALTVGTSTVSFGSGQLCGMCIQVSSVTEMSYNASPYPNPPYIVLLTNYGPTPSDNWLDHNFQSPVGGEWQLTYQAVPCPVTSDIQWQINAGSGTWYLQLLPVYNSLVIEQMCINTNGQWQAMSRVQGGGLWSFGGQQIPDNFQLKAISLDGQVIVDNVYAPLSSGVPQTAIYGGSTPGQFGAYGGNGNGYNDCNAPQAVFSVEDVATPSQQQGATSQPSGSSSGSDSALNPGEIAGVVLGSVFGVTLLLFVVIGVVVVALIIYRSRTHVASVSIPYSEFLAESL